MKKSKVSLNFVKLSNPDKILFYKNVIDSLTNHPIFTSPDVEISVLTDKVLAFEKDFLETKTGSHLAFAEMRLSREAVDEVFRIEALYVDRIAKGDVAIILKSGFQPTKQAGQYKKTYFDAKEGKEPGVILLTCKAISGAKAYLWQYSVGVLPENDKGWELAGGSTQVHFKVVNLESGSKCWFRRAPITKKGIEQWCDPVMKFVP